MEDLHICLCLILVVLLMYHSSNKCGFRNSDVKIYRFYRPSCIHCQRMHNEWAKFMHHCKRRGIHVIDVNMNTVNAEHQQLYERSNGKGVPYIIKIKNGNIEVYRGPRMSDDFIKFALE